MTGKVCAQCEREMYAEKNGVVLVEYMNQEDEQRPYKLWQADLWKCAECGFEAVLGIAHHAFAEHWQEKFPDLLQHSLKQHRVIKCFEREPRPI